ncbi:putative N-acetylglucosaminylphosphatidylinositol deacetylase [Helianthus annuus]|nr:putative N-acetylglucosaminylphosphatidylinositol deacetylase [Helianthus annuus]
MEWFMIFASVAVLWVASLCKILHASFYPYRSSFLNNGAGSLKKRNVLLVIAHPDDESMFFSPTINQLTSRGHNVHILCMSTGNADGMGNVRKEELYRASATLKVPIQQVTVMDHPDFQDGFGKIWNTSLLPKIVEKKIHDHAIDIIITFDNYGVSGHCNHRDVNHGVRRFMLDTSQQEIEAWELVSTNIIRKYSGPVDIWFSLWSAQNSLNGQMHCLLNENPRRSYAAMSQHSSQWVWFRKLFVSFSSYTYVNTLKKINK